jgi:polyhydroxybutyrate depolymerase
MKKHLLMVAAFVMLHSTAQDYTLSLQHDGKLRTFILHTPCKTFDCTGKKIPLVFAFHGLTESGQLIRDYSAFNNIADTAGFAVVYPNGLNNRWNVGFGGSFASGEDDIGFANALIDYFIAHSLNCDSNICAEIDTNRIYSCGMSNGGFFSYLLACRLSHRIAAIASVTGSMTPLTYDSCNPSRPVPVLQIHGTADQIVPYTGGGQSGSKSIADVLTYWVNNNRCQTTPSTVVVSDINTSDNCTAELISYSGCTEDADVQHFKVIGGGHTWPDMVGGYPEIIVGKTNRDFNASVEIWKFFKRFSISRNTSSTGNILPSSFSQLYPNPAYDLIQVREAALCKIYTLDGKLLIDTFLAPYQPLDIRTLPVGMYVGEVNGQKFKLIKEK